MTLDELRNLDLDINRGGEWPAPVKALVMLTIFAAACGLGWYLDTSDLLDGLAQEQQKEQQLRDEFRSRQRVVANLDAYRAQIGELETMLGDMLRQLPTRTEMPNLLEDISNQGRANGLVFTLFKPLDELPREFYAAKPIQIKAQATYHQFGAFVSSIAALPRIVTLEAVSLSAQPMKDFNRDSPEPLNIEATLQTYRYLDEDTEAAPKPAGKRK